MFLPSRSFSVFSFLSAFAAGPVRFSCCLLFCSLRPPAPPAFERFQRGPVGASALIDFSGGAAPRLPFINLPLAYRCRVRCCLAGGGGRAAGLVAGRPLELSPGGR